jgi:hypothetical protein
VDSEGREIEGAPKQPKDTDPSQQPHAMAGLNNEERSAAILAGALATALHGGGKAPKGQSAGVGQSDRTSAAAGASDSTSASSGTSSSDSAGARTVASSGESSDAHAGAGSARPSGRKGGARKGGARKSARKSAGSE